MGNGYASERPGIAAGALLIGGLSLFQGTLFGDGNKTVQIAIILANAIQKMLCHFLAGDFAAFQ